MSTTSKNSIGDGFEVGLGACLVLEHGPDFWSERQVTAPAKAEY